MMEELLERIQLKDFMADTGGRVLVIDDHGNIELTEDLVAKNIGRIYEDVTGAVVYSKKENDKNIFKKYNGWSVLEYIIRSVDVVRYESETCVYEIETVGYNHYPKWGTHELEKKIIIPLEYWKKTYKDTKIKRRLQLFGEEWYSILQNTISSDWFYEIGRKVNEYRARTVVYPEKDDVFKVFQLSPKKIKVVILGQDPYYNSLADGLAFSSNNPEVVIPESLKNIFKEIESSHDTLLLNPDPNLERWHKQGVFLFNTCLTVNGGEPLSHKDIGWKRFSEEVINTINNFNQPIVYLLWGNHARSYKKLVTNPKHLVLEAVHPSPLSAHRGFFGCDHFRKANEFLRQNGSEQINWI